MSDLYILKDKTPVKVTNLIEWGEHDTPEMRYVRQDYVNDCIVSTVFLGLDHAHDGGVPILFETMVFDKDGHAIDEHTQRYPTWEDAEDGHASTLARIKGAAGNSG